MNEPRVDVRVLGGGQERAAQREPAREEISCVSCNSSDVSWYRGGGGGGHGLLSCQMNGAAC